MSIYENPRLDRVSFGLDDMCVCRLFTPLELVFDGYGDWILMLSPL